MAQCEARTKAGRPCHNQAQSGKRFCSIHAGRLDSKAAALVALGAATGNLIVPGLGGAIVGGTLGYWTSTLPKDSKGMKKRVFVSFDFDKDKKLRDFVIGQSRLSDSPFDVIDQSLKEAAPERDWEKKARAAIARSDIVLVMVGPSTHRARGVLKEVQIARDLGKQVVQIIGYKDGNYTAVPNAGRLYQWNWPNLKNLLS